MKPNDRMQEWRQTIAVICTVVLAFAAQSAFMQFERADMNAQSAAMRADMNAQFAVMHAEHAAIREQLNSMDRRTARIEGHLFGIEIPPARAEGE